VDGDEPYLRLQFATIYVRDQQRSLEFFRDQLGFRTITEVVLEPGLRWIVVSPPDGAASLALVLPKPGCDEDRLVGCSGPFGFITEDVEAKHREWSERGVKFTVPLQVSAHGGVVCRFEDPDGNPFFLGSFDKTNREIEEQRRTFAERLAGERRVAQELEIAKQVQARLFPQKLPAMPGLDYAGVCQQARAVGGDYYDFLDLGMHRMALVIGDIAGKGMAAALLMASLQANLRSQYATARDHPEQFLSSVNRLLLESTADSSYATLIFLDYDDGNGQLRYANCGHLPALILRSNGSVDRLDSSCTVVGLFADWECRMAESSLNVGDTLALYTDGVTEAGNDGEEEFGEERLVDSMRRHCRLPARELAGAIVDDVLSFSAAEQYDDITLVIAKKIHSPLPGAHVSGG
jgi:serine phosphatase RsbU (regulator of sigma subunit)/predicted enzyme related to lactoylglutathione lyase